DLADARRPVAEGSAGSGSIRGSRAGAQKVVATPSCEEWAAPCRVVASVRDVLARDPDRVAIDCGRAVVAPPRARGLAADLGSVAREAIIGRCTDCGDVDIAHTGLRVDARISGAWEGRGPDDGHGDDAAAARCDADRGVDEVLVRVSVRTGQRDASAN